MTRQPVESSVLSSVGYDPETRTLEIEFRQGDIYRYHAVPQEVYEKLMAAESKGQFFQASIRDTGYRYEKI